MFFEDVLLGDVVVGVIVVVSGLAVCSSFSCAGLNIYGGFLVVG